LNIRDSLDKIAASGSPAGKTSGERSLLFIAHRIPYPPNKGDKIRSFNEIKHLFKQGWKIHLCTLADDEADLQYVSELRKYCASVFVEKINPVKQKFFSLAGPLRGLPLSAPYFYRPELQRRIDSVLSGCRIDSILCFCGPMAEYVFRSRRLKSSGSCPRLVMDLVDVDSDKWAQYADRDGLPMSLIYRLESKLLSRYERLVVDRFDSTFLVSPAEALVLGKRTGIADKIHAVGNGVDLDYFHPVDKAVALTSKASPRLVFCGAMDYFPNVDAVVWFAREVMPLLREEMGEVSFVIVGSKPAGEVLELRSIPGVEVAGRVDDVRPYVWSSDISIAPIRVARGIQNKVLEAMSMGKAVVSSPEAFEGIEAQPGRDLIVAKTEPVEFKNAVVNLLKNSQQAETVGAAAREAVLGSYCWSRQMSALDRLLVPPQEAI